jgi:hypothetical protein
MSRHRRPSGLWHALFRPRGRPASSAVPCLRKLNLGSLALLSCSSQCAGQIVLSLLDMPQGGVSDGEKVAVRILAGEKFVHSLAGLSDVFARAFKLRLELELTIVQTSYFGLQLGNIRSSHAGPQSCLPQQLQQQDLDQLPRRIGET